MLDANTAADAPADQFWHRLLLAAVSLILVGIGGFPYMLTQTSGRTRTVCLVIGVISVTTAITLSVFFSTRSTRRTWDRRTTFFVIGLLLAPALIIGMWLDGGVNSPLTLILIPPTALAAAAFPPRDAAWHLVPILIGYSVLVVFGPGAPGWLIAMGYGLFASVVLPVAIVRSASLQYVVDQEHRADTLEMASSVDGLTQCLNHRAFHEVLKREVEGPGERHFSLLLIDIDRFKDINDTHGHLAGDKVLAEVGRILRAHARGSDAVGRIGGEEFALLLRRARLAEATEIARRIGAIIADSRPGGVEVTISSGVSETWPGASVAQLRRHTDGLLYEAKASGRNAVVAAAAPPNTYNRGHID